VSHASHGAGSLSHHACIAESFSSFNALSLNKTVHMNEFITKKQMSMHFFQRPLLEQDSAYE
jgi:hypothetical protein